jgi:hypothetical protein
MPVVLLPTTVRTFEGTVADVLARVRYLLQDEGRDAPTETPDPTLYRWSDAELILWVNDALAAAVRINPVLFVKTGQHACSGGYYQTVVLPRAVAIVNVVGVPLADEPTLTQFSPGWQSAPSGPAVNWLRAPGDELSFMLYPPSPSNQELQIMFVQAHLRVDDASDIIELPETHIPALADYVVGQAEAKDDEAINTQRQQVFMQNFAAKIKGAPTP